MTHTKTHLYDFASKRLITEQWALDRIVARAIKLSELRKLTNGPFIGRGLK